MTSQRQEENKAIIRRLYAAFNAGDADALEALVAEDLINHNPWMPNGRAAAQAALRQLGTMEVELLQIVADGDLVAIYGHYKAPADGAGMDFYKLKDGQIVEHWDVRQEIVPQTANGLDMFSELTS
jgi:predicted SnoaL-like aldol condensation-catalyzing enzyme